MNEGLNGLNLLTRAIYMHICIYARYYTWDQACHGDMMSTTAVSRLDPSLTCKRHVLRHSWPIRRMSIAIPALLSGLLWAQMNTQELG